MISRKKILVCPLNWGLGHASRLIPVIRCLEKQGHEIVLGATNGPLKMLQLEFPHLTAVELPTLMVNYPKGKHFTVKILSQLPNFINAVLTEHKHLKKLIREHRFDIVISDNRYGLWSKKAKTIFISHQLTVKMPTTLSNIEVFANRLIRMLTKKFDRCWVPDFENPPNLAGDLSHPEKTSSCVRYIGVLSRFNDSILVNDNPQNDLLAIISGPEPQRSIFEKQITEQSLKNQLKTVIIQGLPGESEVTQINEYVTLIPHLDTDGFIRLIKDSRNIVCRSGYSTIMDLIAIRRNALLVPTAGQTEQEYLAKYLKNKGLFFSMSQENFNIVNGLAESAFYSPSRFQNSYQLEEILRDEIEMLNS